MRAATHKEIRDYLGHGLGNRRVRISRDGRVQTYGSIDPTDRNVDYWMDRRYVEEYGVDDDGAVTPNRRPPGRPVAGTEKRRRYLVTLEPATAERARALADGNLSAGLTLAVEQATRPATTSATPPAG